jgi:serine/threonine-protein kinase
LRIVAQALQGLGIAHEARIVHRDIKPANFYLARGLNGARTVKLLDFGIAKIMRDPADSTAETAGLTSTGSMLGSPLFMAPEQARGLKEIDHRADIWSMGVVLYQALTGRTPHQSTDALGELIIAICTEVPAPIQELAPWVPPEAAAVAHSAIRFDPSERFQSAAEMLGAIQPLLREGWAIDESMLRPLAEAERGRVEARYATVPDTPMARGGRTNASRTGAPASSIDGFGSTLGPDAARPGRGLLIAGAAIALTVGGLLAYKLFGATGPSTATAPTASASVSAPIASAEAPKPRTVRLVILPEGASVEVDGASAEVKDGVVEITGALGSVHDVRVSAGGEQLTRSVVVAESGPVPAKVQIEPKAPKPGPAVRPPTPRPVVTASDLRNQR